ncbi:hypothetical protein SISNIDRAFT_460518 [Sistotremastrum niveocremeum HHB9708]|uniref:TEA domain-containing protein n=1 Tax=Sistotremastrum niveocremeum HHB9708 TaxID=1314777 RepID=A0A164NJ97_9AGAM|nr:hypothetical protein SISNIDRAFT_460518 [Sistotremastrum niveocremeum HHB9708]
MSFLRITSPSSYRPRQKITRVSPPGNSSSSSTTLSSPAESSLPISMDNQQLYEDPTMDDDVLDDEDPDDPASPVARGVIQDRRTCKSFNGEVVWPPKVETALIGALEALLPTTIENCVSKLNLFPDRNKFCSSWIKEKTGYERTPRQVGSRIQMLRQKWRGTDCKYQPTTAHPVLPICAPFAMTTTH